MSRSLFSPESAYNFSSLPYEYLKARLENYINYSSRVSKGIQVGDQPVPSMSSDSSASTIPIPSLNPDGSSSDPEQSAAIIEATEKEQAEASANQARTAEDDVPWYMEFLDRFSSATDAANAIARENAAAANQFAHDEAELAREFEQYNVDTQYQRLVKDLKAAGLNPILAYGSLNTGLPSAAAASAHQAETFKSSEKFTDIIQAILGIVGGISAAAQALFK